MGVWVILLHFTLAAVEAMLDRDFRRWIEGILFVHDNHVQSMRCLIWMRPH